MKNSVWRSMLDADMNVRYWKYLAQRYVNRDRGVKIFLALTSSGTVASWSIWNSIPLIWQILSALSLIIAVISPILNYQKVIESVSDLSGKWWELEKEYEIFWRRAQKDIDDKLEGEYRNVKMKEYDLIKKETHLPMDMKLLKECQKEVLHGRGL